MSGNSNENEQPSTKVTRSLRQCAENVRGRLDRDAVAEHAVARHIGADVDVAAERRQIGAAGLAHGQERARLRVADAEAQEVVGPVRRQDGDVALRHAGAGARGLAGIVAAANFLARLVRRQACERAHCFNASA